MAIREVSLEVLQAEGPVVQITRDAIRDLKERAARSPMRRARICAHPGPDDKTQEMLIVLGRDNYIRPHQHPGRFESFHCMEGLMSVVQFEDDGTILEVVRMGDYASNRTFYYRQTRSLVHAILVESEYVAFQEVTQGPFTREGTIYPAWAPKEGPDGALKKFLDDLRDKIGATSERRL